MGTEQLHKRLDEQTVVTIFERYLARELTVEEATMYLGLKRARFFRLLKVYRNNPDQFTLSYIRRSHKRISAQAEHYILKALEQDKQLIENRAIPVTTYNYSAVRDTLVQKHQITVSVPTIIARAKEQGYYRAKPKTKVHDREVLTNFVGELVQHDSSYHLFSPYMKNKLYLITSLDDYSRLILFAEFYERESSWAHIEAAKSVVLRYGAPFKYYADQHAIFRYVKDRDKQSPWNTYTKFTDDVDPQWKQVLQRCGTTVTYALSPQAKGKIERPYRWMQDRIVRTAAQNQLTTLPQMRTLLQQLIQQYNTRWVHSTTKEIPIVRFEQAITQQRSLFKSLHLTKSDTDINDIFCLCAQRMVDAYRKISLDGLSIIVPNGIHKQIVDLHIVPIPEHNIAQIRFWQIGKLLGTQHVPLEKFKTLVYF